MSEPSRRSSRLAIAAAALAAVVLAGGGFMLGRATSKQPAPEPPPPVATAPRAPPQAPKPILPEAQPPLGRADLIDAAVRAADAFAAGRPVPEAARALVGREFELRLPFGCPAVAQVANDALSWRYDAEEQALRLRAEPVRWAPQEWLGAAANGEAEAIEGFWIARPWTAAEDCPPVAAAGSPGEQAVPTLGIARIFGAEESRVGRRDGAAFEAVEKIAPEALDASRGFWLRLRGRVVSAPGRDPILCRSPAGPGARPVCLISASLDEIAFENPIGNATIAAWDVSSQRSMRPRPGELTSP